MKITIEKDRNSYEKLIKSKREILVNIHVESGEIYGAFVDDEFVPSWFSTKEAEEYYELNWEKIDEQVNDKIYA